jgi:hypothetical protein
MFDGNGRYDSDCGSQNNVIFLDLESVQSSACCAIEGDVWLMITQSFQLFVS